MPGAGDYNTSYALLLEVENKIRLLEPFVGAKSHHKMQCMTCDHVWTATPVSKRQTLKKHGVSGCPACSKASKAERSAVQQQYHIDQFAARGLIILDDYSGLRSTIKKMRFKNIICGHEFESYPGNMIERESSCVVCGKIERTSAVSAWSKQNSAKWRETATEWQVYKSKVSALTEQIYKKHKSKINPTNLPRGKAGVEGAYHLDHIVPKRFCFDNGIPEHVCADYTNLQMIGWRENVGSRNHIKGTVPPTFFQYISAGTKLEAYADQLIKIFPTAIRFCTIGDVVTTVYDQHSNRAIVVIPIDQQHANQKSALTASKALELAGVQHIILFEDEMVNHQLLEAKLKHYTHTGTVDRLHARQCDIRQCDKSDKKALLDANHVQGSDGSHIAYGAYHNDKLVAVMTFSKPRVALGQKGSVDRTGKWELSRFCTDVSVRIPGIASKLLKHFQRSHAWTEIYSYADKRWSVGNMYHQLGFDLVADNKPDYTYVIDGVRKHRWNYRKDILKNTLANYDPTLTEYQNMENHGMWRIWDCGTLKFSVTNQQSEVVCLQN